ncbi:MAG: hypothetical protein U0792_17025 [Gemmataceae bacterium]
MTATVPTFLHKTGTALAADAKTDDRVLVVVQLGGGNDGLNTVVPFADDLYHKARPKIAVPAKSVLKLDDALGFHPELVELHKLYKDGGLAVVSNVGYPNPNRSHFRSTDIWETASPADKILKSGWLGRYFDRAWSQADPLGVRIRSNGARVRR